MRNKRIRFEDADSVEEQTKLFNEIFGEIGLLGERVELLERKLKKGAKKVIKKVTAGAIVLLLLSTVALGTVSVTDINFNTVQPEDSLVQLLRSKFAAVNDDITSSSVTGGQGDIYYVNSNVTTAGDGQSWNDAKATLDEAVALCTEDVGDIIYVAAGHTEDWSAADSADLDVAGISVIGLGNG